MGERKVELVPGVLLTGAVGRPHSVVGVDQGAFILTIGGSHSPSTDNLVFVPASATAQVGGVVEFKNTGSVAHTVTFQGSNNSCLTDDTLAPGATWEVKFTVAGTYNYICTIHAPNMKGEITVS